jgi:glucosamine--fructose-6-phosphate aminotransferase (isomerizing)
MAIFVSQSGETADTLAALRHASGKVAKVVSVVNVATSSIARESDLALPILAGVEVGVASTKAFTCQLTVLALMALKAAQDRGRIDAATLKARLVALSALPGLMNAALSLSDPDRQGCRGPGQGAGHPVPGARVDVPAGTGRCAETKGNQLHPR